MGDGQEDHTGLGVEVSMQGLMILKGFLHPVLDINKEGRSGEGMGGGGGRNRILLDGEPSGSPKPFLVLD